MLFGPKGPFCQSCGMPLNKDEGHGGTNVDGSHSTEYCSKCFANGQFTEPNMTLQQMQEKVKGKMKEMHFPKFMANYFTKDMDKLKRWAK
jgi:hypothetical protein